MIPEKRKKKLAVVGTADSWKLAPFNQPDWEIWGVNNLYILLQKMIPPVKPDRWFEIHEITFDKGKFRRRGDAIFRGKVCDAYLKELADIDCEIFMQKHWDIVPKSVAYPLKEILDQFPSRYFTNTISYELALGIAMKFEEIGVWGVDMAVGGEYHYQRPSVEYFIGIAEGKGIPIHIPAEADLLKSLFLYGFEERRQGLFEKKLKLSLEQMSQRQQQAAMVRDQKNAEFQQYVGAISATKEISKIWANLGTDEKIMDIKGST
jgi:hypothetical protein